MRRTGDDVDADVMLGHLQRRCGAARTRLGKKSK
jgi:hypothetical protein